MMDTEYFLLALRQLVENAEWRGVLLTVERVPDPYRPLAMGATVAKVEARLARSLYSTPQNPNPRPHEMSPEQYEAEFQRPWPYASQNRDGTYSLGGVVNNVPRAPDGGLDHHAPTPSAAGKP